MENKKEAVSEGKKEGSDSGKDVVKDGVKKAEHKKDGSEKYTNVKKVKEKLKQEDILPILKMVAPGTALRSAITDIVRAKKGALIVVDTPNLSKILEGGFRINCRFTPQKLVELSKLDGAMILSNDMNKILSANTLLAPDINIPTRETGTRRTRRQKGQQGSSRQ